MNCDRSAFQSNASDRSPYHAGFSRNSAIFPGHFRCRLSAETGLVYKPICRDIDRWDAVQCHQYNQVFNHWVHNSLATKPPTASVFELQLAVSNLALQPNSQVPQNEVHISCRTRHHLPRNHGCGAKLPRLQVGMLKLPREHLRLHCEEVSFLRSLSLDDSSAERCGTLRARLLSRNLVTTLSGYILTT